MKHIITFIAIVIAFTACKKDENKGPFPGTNPGEKVSGGYILSRDSKGHGIMMSDTDMAVYASYVWASQKTDTMTNGGYDNWRLPTESELKIMYEIAYSKGIGDFPSYKGYTKYWGAAANEDSVYVGYFSRNDGAIYSKQPKSGGGPFRPVRNY